MPEQRTPDRLVSFVKTGNSTPVILQLQGNLWFVKLYAGMSGRHALLMEWIGHRMAAHLQLPCMQPAWIWLPENLQTGGVHQEVADLIAKSQGYNLAFPYIPHLENIVETDLPLLEAALRQQVFLLDLCLLNIDRTRRNTNLVRVNDAVMPIDFESASLLTALLYQPGLLNNQRFLEQFRLNPLYQSVEPAAADAFVHQLETLDWAALLEPVPEQAMDTLDKQQLADLLNRHQQQGWKLHEILQLLPDLQPETEAERRRRVEANRLKFEREYSDSKKRTT